MSAHWPVNDGEDRSGTIPQEGMARWEVRLSAIASTHYKPGIPAGFACRVIGAAVELQRLLNIGAFGRPRHLQAIHNSERGLR